jgi:hypothetical protein
MSEKLPLLSIEGSVSRTGARPRITSGTMYVKIPLHIGGRPDMTAIFVPDGFSAAGPVDLILYLHGHTSTTSIKDYLTRRPYRKIVNESGKNVVFVAPTLGLHSEIGNLASRQGAFDFLDYVRRFLTEYGPYDDWPLLGVVVLAAHSGGGSGMLKLAKTYQGTLAMPEAWLFDCLYGAGRPTAAPEPLTVRDHDHAKAATMDAWQRALAGSPEKDWYEWARLGHKVRAFWGAGHTLTRTANLDLMWQLGPWPSVEVNPHFFRTGSEDGVLRIDPTPPPVSAHDLVPQTVLGKCIRECSALDPKS